MRYYIPGVGYVNENEQFTGSRKIDGQDVVVTFPRGSLPSVAAELGAVAKPEAPSGKKVVEGESGWEIVNLTQEELDAIGQSLIASAWAQADHVAMEAADHNSREKYLDWKYDETVSQTRKDRISAINAWMDGVWSTYYAYKSEVTAGNHDAVLGDFGTCPYSFAQVIEV